MIEFIPISLYTPIFYYVILAVVIFTSIQISLKGLTSISSYRFSVVSGNALLLFVVLYMGLRPIDKVFVDMVGYASRFIFYQNGGQLFEIRDIFFQIFTKFLSGLVDVSIYFLICALLYIMPLYISSKRLFNRYWYYSFLVLLASFSFWAYGTNGIRNGIAASLFTLAITSKNRKWVQYTLFVISILFHKSLVLPLLAYVLSIFYKNIKGYFAIWIISILLSLLLGSFWENLFLSLGFDDERLSYLGAGADEDKFSSTGFRWDFLVYSGIGVFAAYYFIFRRKFHDPYYNQLVSLYLFCNSIWILVIRANFSNRFAYLSWFLLGLVVFYPMLKQIFFKFQGAVLAQMLLLYYFVTFTLMVILN